MSPIPKAPGAPSSKTRVSVSISMRVPGASTARTAKLKRIYTVAQNTAGVQVAVFPAGNDSGTPLATSVANIEVATDPGSTCGASDAYGNRTCTFAISAPLGADDFVITTYDQAPATGATTIPAGANELGVGTDAGVTIAAGGTYSISTTLNSVLASVSLTATPSAFHQMQPSTGTIGVIALDADSDVIVSNGFVDANGNPVSISLGLSNSLSGTLNLSTSSISAPAAGGVQYQYTPAMGVLPNSSSVTSTITASTSNTGATASANVNAIYPAFTNISDGNLNVTNMYHGGMGFDKNGGVYFSTEASPYGTIDYFSGVATSTPTTLYTGTALYPVHGSTGADTFNDLYVVTGSEVMDFFMSGGTLSLGNSGTVPPTNGSALAYSSSSGLFAYASSASIATISCGEGCGYSNYSTPIASTGGVTFDPSGNVWVVDNFNNAIYEESSGNVNGPYYLGTPGTAFDILANANGLFLTAPNGDAIVRTTLAGQNATAVSLPNNASPFYLMPDTDPNDGVFWFSYAANGQIGIGRMDTNSGLITMAPDAANGSPYTYSAGAIGASPNGMVYIVADGANTLVEVSR